MTIKNVYISWRSFGSCLSPLGASMRKVHKIVVHFKDFVLLPKEDFFWEFVFLTDVDLVLIKSTESIKLFCTENVYETSECHS